METHQQLSSPSVDSRGMESPSPGSDGSSSWSKLPLDLLHMVFERLGFADFQRVKSVCLSWESASTQSTPKNQVPWLILFPEEGKDYYLLFNPEEKEKIYRIQDLGVNFANSRCLAVYGSWLFMQDSRNNLYIMNIFTREKIDLPSVESQIGKIKIERTIDDMFLIKDEDVEFHRKDIDIDLSLFWIDEKTKDYVVIWGTIHFPRYSNALLVYSRKGDSYWKQINNYDGVCMAYKDHKLYSYSTSRDVKVFDFSGDIPQQIFETQINYNRILVKGIPRQIYPHLGDVIRYKETHLVVSVTGEILRVDSKIRSDSDVWYFRIYKLDSSNNLWEKITSLGDEAILLDQGITLLANANEGVKRNSIYFSGIHYLKKERDWSIKDIFIFNLDTGDVERPPQSFFSSIQSSSDARWFVPNFKW